MPSRSSAISSISASAPGDRHVADGRQARRAGGVYPQAGDALAQPRLQPVPQRADARHRRPPAPPPPAPPRRRIATADGHVLRAAAQAALLPAAVQQRIQPRPAPHEQRAGAARAAQLVRAEGQPGPPAPGPPAPAPCPAPAPRRSGTRRPPPRRAPRSARTGWTAPTSLLAHITETSDGSPRAADDLRERIHVHDARPHPREGCGAGQPSPTSRLGGREHGLVLDGGAGDGARRPPARGPGRRGCPPPCRRG